MKSSYKILSVGAIILLSACATMVASPDAAQDLLNFQASFKEKGIAKLDRLQQSELQKTCSDYAQKELPAELRERLEKAERNAVKYPIDGQYLGN